MHNLGVLLCCLETIFITSHIWDGESWDGCFLFESFFPIRNSFRGWVVLGWRLGVPSTIAIGSSQEGLFFFDKVGDRWLNQSKSFTPDNSNGVSVVCVMIFFVYSV